MKKKNIKNNKEFNNGLASFAQGICNGMQTPFYDIPDQPLMGIGNTASLQATNSLFYNNRYYLVSNFRSVLSELYVEHAIVQTLIDLPVEDALLRQTPKVVSTELSEDELSILENKIQEIGLYENVAQAFKWNRLFGGAGIIINEMGKDPKTPFDIKKVKKGDNIEFYVADRWELSTNPYSQVNTLDNPTGITRGINFNYYGTDINPSRVIVLKGKEAPSIKKQQLGGWGMSEVERLVGPMNKYLKNQNVIYELIDEAKIDVYSLDNYRSAIYSGQEKKLQQALMWSNMMKNYLNAMVLDKNDNFDQKQMSFGGLAEILRESYLDIASAVRIPVTKLFGMSASGFNSGEDDLENYNSMIEREVRYKSKRPILQLIKIICMQEFGEIPDDLDIQFPSLRVLKQVEEEMKFSSIYRRVQNMYASGLITQGELYDILSKENVINSNLAIKGSNEYVSDFVDTGLEGFSEQTKLEQLADTDKFDIGDIDNKEGQGKDVETINKKKDARARLASDKKGITPKPIIEKNMEVSKVANTPRSSSTKLPKPEGRKRASKNLL